MVRQCLWAHLDIPLPDLPYRNGELQEQGKGSTTWAAHSHTPVTVSLWEDFERMNCVEEAGRARDIVKRGTSAHRQVEIYEKSMEAGATHEEAMEAVVDWLIAETVNGV